MDTPSIPLQHNVVTPSSSRPACIYVRVSTREQAQDGKLSLASQEAECRKHADRLGYTVTRVAKEIFSGAELYERPVLSEVREELRAGKYHALLLLDDDRATRDPVHYLVLADECFQYHIDLIIGGVPFENTDEGRLIAHVRGYASKLERLRIRERSLRNKLARVRSGKIFGMGPELYGYRRDKQAGVRRIYEPEAAIVRQIFQWVVDEHLGVRSIVARLIDRGVPPPSEGKMTLSGGRAAHWSKTQVQKMLTNPAYKGDTIAWRTQRPASAKDRAKPTFSPAEGRLIRPESEWIHLPAGVTPPIVSPELWQAAQAIRRENRGTATRAQLQPRLLRGRLFCGVCGRSMAPETDSGGKQIYRCSSRQAYQRTCGGGRVPGATVEEWAWQQVTEVLRHPNRVLAELKRREEHTSQTQATQDLDRMKHTMAKLTKKQADLLRKFTERDDTDDGFPWDVVQREIARLEREKSAYQENIARLEAHLATQRYAANQLAALHTFCERIVRRLDACDFAERRMVFDALGIVVVGNRRDWTLRGEIPLDGEPLWAASDNQAANAGGDEEARNLSMLCAPLAATSSARLTCSWPRTSARS